MKPVALTMLGLITVGCLPGGGGGGGGMTLFFGDGGDVDGGAGEPDAAMLASCGNGVKDPGEACEGTDVGGLTCDALGLGEGVPTCAPGCARLDTSGCSGAPPPPAGCGNGTIDEGEVCDGQNLGNASCDTLGLDPGTLRCAADCRRFDPSGCGGGDCEPTCGARVCGPDPTCGTSCGVCNEGACNTQGQCEVNRDPSAPRFLQFGTNVQVLNDGDTAVFTAVLTDDDGIDDLIGGTLIDARTGSTLGSFVSAAQEGAYSLRVTWDDFHTSSPLNFGPNGEERTFRAEFFDAGGLSSSAETTLRLRCGSAGHSACDAVCFDLQTDQNNCGRCGNVVRQNGGAGIECRQGAPACVQDDPLYFICDGVCIDGRFDDQNCGRCGKTCNRSDTGFSDCRASEYGNCVGEFVVNQRTTCRQVCPQKVPGGACTPYEDTGRAYYSEGDRDFEDVDCDTAPPPDDGWGNDFQRLHCYCQY
ncbi:MAG: hypothetical protein KC583_01280 [Myxococcales bacterium]|nr:hypothetical protein [Myxococcales bacterium]